MPLDVIAVPRSRAIVLAAVLPPGSDSAKGGAPRKGTSARPGTLALVAEDGARFRFPEAHAILRVTVKDGRDADDPETRIAALRARLEPFTDWLALKASFKEGERFSVEQAAEAVGLGGVKGRLRVALGVAAAEPWFRRDGAELIVVPTREALEKLFHMNVATFSSTGDALVADWWPNRAEGIPGGWVDPAGDIGTRARIAAEQANFFDHEYTPDEDTAAAAAVAALIVWAMAGETATDQRGRELAKRVGLPDDPDHVLEALVEVGALGSDVDPATHRAGLAAPFDEDVTAAATTLANRPFRPADREDFSDLFAVAVDDSGTREVDDAISLRRVGDDWELLVHIADVASVIDEGSALDAIAATRASSLFLPDRSVLMLPEDLVAERLSLAVGESRPALTGVFRLSDTGEVLEARFTPSIVRLSRSVRYAETRDPAVLGESAVDGARLVALAGTLRAARAAAGARILSLPSCKVVVEDGAPRVGLRVQDTPGDLVVSEAMVLHNAQAGEALAAAGAAGIFRGQGAENPSGRTIPERDDPLYAWRIRRTFAPTETSSAPLVHSGLGVGAYVQCTSPIRRYGDLVNQRQLTAVARGEAPSRSAEDLAALIPVLQERERRVRRAADTRSAYWMARAVETDSGGTIVGVLAKAPRRGLGSVWVPGLCRALPLRAPRGWTAPPEGTEAEWRVAAIRPFRGRVELAPAE